LSRVRYFVLFAALIALAIALAACGSSGSGSSENPQKVVDNATLKGIQSGNLDLSLGVNVEGDEGGHVDVSLSGPFQSQGSGSEQLPELDMTAKASGSVNGENVDFEGGLTLLSDRAFVNYKGTEYAVDSTTFSFVKSAMERAQKQGGAQGKSTDVTACQEAVSNLKVGSFVDNLTNEGSADVGGASTTHVSGDLNVPGAIDALLELTKDPACSAQLGAAGPLPSEAELDKAKSQVESALKTAHVDLYVGDDNIVRKIAAGLSIEPPNASKSGPKKVDLQLELSIDGVNEDQTIEAPSGAKPLNDLFLKLGVNPIELLGAASGQGGLGGLSGAGGLGSLLNGLGGGTGGSSGDGSSSGGSSSGGASAPSANAQQAYLNCLKGATTPVDLQKCAGLLK
jgi:hypothetical protein